MAISLTTIVERNEAIIFTEIDDIIVLMDVDEGQYYELDAIGTKIWTLLKSAADVGAICDALQTEFEVAPETCRDDVLAFVADLCHHGVVRTRAAGGDEEPSAP